VNLCGEYRRKINLLQTGPGYRFAPGAPLADAQWAPMSKPVYRPPLRLVRSDDALHAPILRPEPLRPLDRRRRTLRQSHDGGAPLRNAREIARATRKIESANRASSKLKGDDVRRIFALRVEESLEGGRAALLPLERRQRLMGVARRLGIRAFDANLVIAVAQDRARRGEGSAVATGPRVHNSAASTSHPDAARRSLLPPPARQTQRHAALFRRAALRLAFIVLFAGAMLTALVVWVLRPH